MKMYFNAMASICVLALFGQAVYAADEVARDPFAPAVVTTKSKPAAKKMSKEVVRTVSSDFKKLDDHPVGTYKLVGVVVSKKNTLALIKDKANQDFFLKKGDLFGQEQAVIKDINIERMLVVFNDKEVTIPVKNKQEEPKDDGKAR